jgi:hypothetical protein
VSGSYSGTGSHAPLIAKKLQYDKEIQEARLKVNVHKIRPIAQKSFYEKNALCIENLAYGDWLQLHAW